LVRSFNWYTRVGWFKLTRVDANWKSYSWDKYNFIVSFGVELAFFYSNNIILDKGKLKTLDLVEVNPLIKETEKDIEKTVFSATRAILSFFGYNTIGTVDTNTKIPQPFDYVTNI
jgi:hypothetical protein